MNEFNSLERKAGVLDVQGLQTATIHAGMFMQVLAAHDAGNEKLVGTYVQRFPPDLRKAYDAWLAQEPFTNPDAALFELRRSVREEEDGREQNGVGEILARDAARSARRLDA